MFYVEAKIQVTNWFLKGMVDVEKGIHVVTMPHTPSVSNFTQDLNSLQIKPKVKLHMLFKLITAAKDSLACLVSYSEPNLLRT